MLKTVAVLFCLVGLCPADDIFLKNGYIHRNVRITSAEGNIILFMKNDSVSSSVRRDDVLRMEYVKIDSQSRYAFELSDTLVALDYEARSAPSIPRTSAAKQGLTESDTLKIPLIPSRQNALRYRGEWGNPAGMKISFGFIVHSIFAFDLFISNYGSWSRSPNVQRYGISASLYTNISILPWHPVVPYLQLGRGFRFGGLFGGGDHYTQIGVGLFMPVYGNTGVYVVRSITESTIDTSTDFFGPAIYEHSILDGTMIGFEMHFSI